MDDFEFDIDQLDQLLDFISSSPPPPPSTTLQEQDSSISLQTQSSNDLVTISHKPKEKPIITNINTDDQSQDAARNPPKGKEKKKVIRRDIERQRRRDMAKLYQRLRLLIPSKYLMGKRSISDHLEEIVDYVKDLRKNIEDLERKRDSLKNICSSDHLAPSSSSMKLSDHDINNGNDDDDTIRVKSCNEGVEISVKGGLPLSKVLKVLMKEGLIVNCCVSSTVNQKLLHIIQSKVKTREDIDLARLRHKLMSLS
ncbi:transcription factor bHLH118-like [Lycium barbarum]|uniref:transcription factor bHLH118-like n=1 Tax=Lycium barbarum TaxID=112863 RepID=UPI00293E3C9B|nr:transcription factor bHLH118-like [Lycium barbarum]